MADGFALIELESAIALREAGIRQPILMLEGFYAAEELPLFAEYGLTAVLHSLGRWRLSATWPCRRACRSISSSIPA